jgi:hypothetical protein
MKSNIVSPNLSIIIKNIFLLLFIGILFISIISLFTKTKKKENY